LENYGIIRLMGSCANCSRSLPLKRNTEEEPSFNHATTNLYPSLAVEIEDQLASSLGIVNYWHWSICGRMQGSNCRTLWRSRLRNQVGHRTYGGNSISNWIDVTHDNRGQTGVRQLLSSDYVIGSDLESKTLGVLVTGSSVPFPSFMGCFFGPRYRRGRLGCCSVARSESCGSSVGRHRFGIRECCYFLRFPVSVLR